MSTTTEALIIDIQAKNEDKVKGIKTQIREATQEAYKLTQQYGEFDDRTSAALKKLANLKDIQGDINQRVKALSPDRFERIAAVGQGLVGGFQTFSGVLGVVGVKSQDWEQTMIRLQSLVNISQGLQSFKSFYEVLKVSNLQVSAMGVFQKANAAATLVTTAAMKMFGVATIQTSFAFKALKAAIVATGIGALIVGITMVVQHISEMGDESEKTAKKMESLNSVINKTVDELGAMDQLIVAQMKQRKASESEIFQQEQQGLLRKKRLLQAALDAENESADARKAIAKDLRLVEIQIQTNKTNFETEQQRKADEAKIASTQKTIDNQKRLNEKATAAYQAELDRQKQANEEFQQALDELAKEQEAREQTAIDTIKSIHEELTQFDADEFDKRRFALQKSFEEQKEILIAGGASANEIIALEELNSLKKQQILDDETKALEDNVVAQLDILEAKKQKELQIEKDKADQKMAYMKMLHQMELDGASSLAGNLSALLGQQTTAGKFFALAEVGISEGRALANALANANGPTPDNIATGGVAGLAKFLTIAASITGTAIKARNIIKGSGGGGMPSSSSFAAPSSSMTVGSFNSQQFGKGTDGGNSGQGGQPVLVVESFNSTNRRLTRTRQISSME